MSFFLTASNIKPSYEVTFSNGDRNIGRLDFNGDVMVFEGDAEESAQVFFNFLAEKFAGRLKEERENEREACAKLVETGLLSEVTLGIYGDDSLAKDVAADIRARGEE